MSSQWMNKFAIMRDLSLAQGCLPVEVEGVEAGDKPPSPSLNFREDTEEQFYNQWVGGNGDFSAPDLGLIKHMLEEVRNHNLPSDEDFDSGVIQIKKLNPLCPEFKPRGLDSGDKVAENPKELKKKKQRNVAVESLLQNIKETATENKQTFKQFKPTDFSAETNVESSNKVFDWLPTQADNTLSPTRKNVPMLHINPMSMFKKKKATETTAVPVQEVKNTSPYNYNKYKPSKKADEYYKKFLECSEMQKMVDEDVWTKVERQMKEIDERRKAEAELFSLSLALSKEQSESDGGAQEHRDPIQQKLDLISLPQHRHLLASPCAVCAHRTRREAGDQRRTEPHADDQDDDSINKLEESVDDPWWNWRDTADKHVDDNWRVRNETVEHTTDSNDKTVEEKKHEDLKWSVDDADEIDAWRSEILSDVRNETAVADNTDSNDKTVEDKQEMKKHEDVEWWRSPLDEADEIDAWRSEILGDDDDDDEQNIECQNIAQNLNETPQCLKDTDPSWQNEDHDNVVYSNLEKWRSLLLGKKEDNILSKVENTQTKSPNVLPQTSKCNEEMKDMKLKLETEYKKNNNSPFPIDQIKNWLGCSSRRQ